MSPIEEHLLAAYLGGELNDDASIEFERMMLERQALADMVHADAALSIGLKSTLSTSFRGVAPEQTQSAATRKTLRWRRFVIPSSLAASLLAFGYGFGWLSANQTGGPPEAVVVASFVNVDAQRGSRNAIEVTSARPVALAVPVSGKSECEIEISMPGRPALRAKAYDRKASFDMQTDLGVATIILRDRTEPGMGVVTSTCSDGVALRYPVTFK